MEEKLKEKTTQEWVNILNENGVPSGAILGLEDALRAAQIQHRETLSVINEKDVGELPLFNLTAKFEKTPGNIESAPPKLSAHTESILTGAGYSKDEINEFKEKGII